MAKDDRDDSHVSPEALAELRERSEAREKANAEKRRAAWVGEKGAKKLSTHLRALSQVLPADEQAALIYGPEGQLHGLPLFAQLAEDRLREIREGDYPRGQPEHGLEDWKHQAGALAQSYINVLGAVMETDETSFLQAVASGENQRLNNLIGSMLDDAIGQLEALKRASVRIPLDEAKGMDA